jgi:LysM repeat protein
VVPAASANSAAAPSAAPSGTAYVGSPSYGGYPTYVVRRGDNLTKIAWRYGTTVWALMQCNNIRNPDRIYAGQVLRICGVAHYPPPPPYRPPAPKPPPPPPPPPPHPCQYHNGPSYPDYSDCQAPPLYQPLPPFPPVLYGNWHAQFFNNTGLSGSPVVERTDPAIAFDWGWGSPAPGVNAINFSARWTGTFWLNGGRYAATTRSDDGVRVWIDGQIVIDNWTVHAPVDNVQYVQLGGGNHDIRVEYFQATERDMIFFSLVNR